jgi:hypothetical protein
VSERLPQIPKGIVYLTQHLLEHLLLPRVPRECVYPILNRYVALLVWVQFREYLLEHPISQVEAYQGSLVLHPTRELLILHGRCAHCNLVIAGLN